MAAIRYCIRERNRRAPALALAQSFWALQQRRRPIEDSLETACAAGYTYLEAGLTAERMPVLRDLLRAFPMRLIAQGWATKIEEARAFVQRATDLNACSINFHLGHAYMGEEEAVTLIQAVQQLTADQSLPLLLETHRGRLTQDLYRTASLLRRLPDLPLVLDVSHYVVAGEGQGGSGELFSECMAEALRHTAMVHGRWSDGQSVQVRTEDHPAMLPVITNLWRCAMREWLADAPPDAIFVFEPELGPPPYAGLDAEGQETLDRELETDVLAAYARALWDEAGGNHD